jgi:outer membrane protein OmpU
LGDLCKAEGNEMKNILIATTALVATAGVAAADVTISGYARFGGVYQDLTEETTVASRFRFNVDASTETDGGLTFGVRQRFETEENTGLNTVAGFEAGANEARFYGSAGGVTIALGNIIGVIEAAPGLYMNTKSAGVGLEGNGFSNLATSFSTPLGLLDSFTLAPGSTIAATGVRQWTGYRSKGEAQANNGVEIIYDMNGVGLHAHSTDTTWAVGADYKFGDYVAAVAYEEIEDVADIFFASIGGKWGAFDATLSYANGDYSASTVTVTDAAGTATSVTTGWDADKWVLTAGYTVNDAVYVYGFVATEDNDIGVDLDEAFGLGASYALGGGASIEGGWTQNQLGINIVSAGVFFSF